MNKMERIKIAAVIIDNKGHVLFVRKIGKKGYIYPGGKPEVGETEIECLKRELKEELNVGLVSAEFYGKKRISKSIYDNLPITIKSYLTKIKGKPKPSREIEEYRWINANQINSITQNEEKRKHYKKLFQNLERKGLFNK